MTRADEIGVQARMEIQKQNERLLKIDNSLQKLDSTSKRVMAHLRNFAKTYMTDKFIMCMTCLILLAILGIIIAAFLDDKTKD